MLTGFNAADWAIVGVVCFSALISLVRGFVKEALSLFTWAAALFIAISFHPAMMQLLEPLITKPYLRDIVAYVLLFAGSLVVGSLFAYVVAEMVKRTGLSGTDRLLGMIFGVARGLIVVLAIVVMLPSLLTDIELDRWWQSSQLIPEFLVMEDWAEQVFNGVIEWFSSLWAQHRS